MPKKFVRRVIRVGGSRRVAIPPLFVEIIGLQVNDKVEISLTAEKNAILIRPIQAGENVRELDTGQSEPRPAGGLPPFSGRETQKDSSFRSPAGGISDGASGPKEKDIFYAVDILERAKSSLDQAINELKEGVS